MTPVLLKPAVIKHALLVWMLALSALAGAAPLPPESVLQLSNAYTDQSGSNFQLAARRGHVQLVGMFYTSCTYTCPLMIDSARRLDRALTPAQRNDLRVLLVSIDPARDSPAVLAAMAVKRKLDTSRWTLARTDDDGVRKLAALLGVRYRKLTNGDFNHTSGLILLDADGRILARTEQLGAAPDPKFVSALRAALAKSSAPVAR